MSEPFNLDTLVIEAERKDFSFVFGGESYTLPANPDIFASIAIQSGRVEDGLRRLLGADQWARMIASDAVMDAERFKALLTAYQAYIGVELGESSASPASSKSTARRSKRTSNGSTASS